MKNKILTALAAALLLSGAAAAPDAPEGKLRESDLAIAEGHCLTILTVRLSGYDLKVTDKKQGVSPESGNNVFTYVGTAEKGGDNLSFICKFELEGTMFNLTEFKIMRVVPDAGAGGAAPEQPGNPLEDLPLAPAPDGKAPAPAGETPAGEENAGAA